jgi:hypothetical protein
MNGGTRQTKLSRWHGAHTARSQATFELDPKHTALLTIDMQDEFVRPGWTAYWVPEATRIAVSNAADYAKFLSRSYYAVIHIYDDAGNVIDTHEQAGESSTYTTFGSTLTIVGERNVQ